MLEIGVLLLAAGAGTRLRPLTDLWPKCLMPINRRPLLAFWLETLKAHGLLKVLVNTHHHSARVDEFLVQDKYSQWVRAAYEPRLLGTAGTLRANASFFRGCVVLLAHADNWCHCNFEEFIGYHLFKRPGGCPITMMTFECDSPESCGVVETDTKGVVIAFHEKILNLPSSLANGAVYLLEPEVLEWLESKPSITDFSTEVLPHYVGRIATWHNSGIHRDIGTLSRLRAAQTDQIPPHLVLGKDEWQQDFESSPIFNELMRYIEPQELLNDR